MQVGIDVGRGSANGAENPVGRQLLLRIKEAALILGVSVDTFERHVEPKVKVVRIGRIKLVPMTELERFSEDEAYLVGGAW
jgi:hypothetical protein